MRVTDIRKMRETGCEKSEGDRVRKVRIIS